jgi:thioredoxin-like negative regulator of GroEL
MSVNIMKNISDLSFTSVLQNATKPCVVLFTTDYSGTSQIMFPILEIVGRDYAEAYDFYKARCEESRDAVAQFGIRVVPTLAIFKDSKLVGVRINTLNDEKIRAFLDDFTAKQ